MANLVNFWQGKTVFLTGHTGFKGSWLSIWLGHLGANVVGYALAPDTKPALFNDAKLSEKIDSHFADIRDFEVLRAALIKAKPDIVIHMAAQPLVRLSYSIPVDTYTTNVMGTVYLLEAVRSVPSVRAVVNVTTDKCYENHERFESYREDEAMGGHDPYSSSKACAELVTSAYRRSFFQEADKAAIATARAGNVIGGGDWATDRLIPDILRAIAKKEKVRIRNPHAIRPWQHVLEPLSGYLVLAQALYEKGQAFAQAFNFGPVESDAQEVTAVVDQLISRVVERWEPTASYEVLPENPKALHEAHFLKLDCSKARELLHWQPRWSLAQALDAIVDWHQAYEKNPRSAYDVTLAQIKSFEQEQN